MTTDDCLSSHYLNNTYWTDFCTAFCKLPVAHTRKQIAFARVIVTCDVFALNLSSHAPSQHSQRQGKRILMISGGALLG